jgi:hypothetical protein
MIMKNILLLLAFFSSLAFADVSVNPGVSGNYGFTNGTWTPVWTYVTPGDVSVTYGTQLGTYMKIGNRAYVQFNIVTNAFTFTTASGLVEITGLPAILRPEGTTNNTGVGTCVWQGITNAGYGQLNAITNGTNLFFILQMSGTGVALSNVSTTQTPSGGTIVLRCSVTYQTS